MLRFPNPGSNIEGFIKIYCELFDALNSQPYFTLDDISRTLVARNLATSSGFMGQEALSRSTREDRSRDPLYNQSKMYAELFRMLGWFHSLPDSNLKYRMTYLGAHVASAHYDVKSLFRESILGIVFPNEILENKGSYILRPFAAILSSMVELDGAMCRDEMIVGPLSLRDDTKQSEFKKMIGFLKSLRGNYKRLDKALKIVSKHRKITLNTMHNYTRFPLAVLLWCGWTQKERNSSIYNKSIVFQKLTDLGKVQADELRNGIDLRYTMFKKIKGETKVRLARYCFFSILVRAGFDLSPVKEEMVDFTTSIFPKLFKKSKSPSIFFSPYQELGLLELERIFPETKRVSAGQELIKTDATIFPEAVQSSDMLSSYILVKQKSPMTHLSDKDQDVVKQLLNIYKSSGQNIDKAVKAILKIFESANKDKFYPLVVSMFRILSFNCEHSRVGVNYQRWDAIIIDASRSIPIEIKSPGEGQNISVKAVRQALENKVILLSRKSFPTDPNTTSLVVGYYLPNDRSEVSMLIEDIRKTFNFRIGIIDFSALVTICYEALINNEHLKYEDLANLYGYLKV